VLPCSMSDLSECKGFQGRQDSELRAGGLGAMISLGWIGRCDVGSADSVIPSCAKD